MNTYLMLSWSISRGRDTAGYNICRLDDRATGKRYRTCGGGYDMIGTVFGEWLQSVHQDRLQLLRTHGPQGTPELVDCGYSVKGWTKRPDLYGLTFSPKGDARLDGGCGIESMIRVAEACGINVTRDYGRNNTRGFFIS